ncbi:MAG: response regulator, partial [Gammaproteobacteria bacterium]|nr:response regulator [Gammaproteobacteria bacterium]
AVQFLKMCATADPMLASSCNMIARQVAHIKQQLDDLLDIARIMQGKITLTTEHLKISDIVDQAIETSSPLIESRRQELVVSQATTLWIAGDRTRLVQTLSNLLNNAAKYTHEGGNITLRVMREGSEVVIAVRDNGIGISPDLLPHVFDPFTQADHSLAHSQGGLGIGLSMVRQLVELHGGKVMVESAGINRGSLFTVRLPALQTEHPAPGAGLTETAVAMSKLRILVVDDYPDAAESMMLLLQANGHEVETAGFGFQAIERARVFRPQVVLLDIGLPDMDGYEVSRQMRDMPESREAKIIALTGYGTHKDVERARLAGFNHHLLKPVDYETLSSILSSI